MSEAVAAGTEDARGLTPVERVVDTFIEPSKTFTDIKRNRSWWLPFLLMSILGYVFVFSAMQHIGLDTIATNAMKANPRSAARLSTQTPEQQAQALSITKGVMRGTFYGVPVLVLLFNAIFALLLWFGFAFILGGSTSFGEMFAVSMFASLPNALSSIVSTIVVFFIEPQSFNINTPSPTNLAFFLNADAAPWLRSLLGSIDLFALWSLALSGFGAAIVSKVKPTRGILLVFAVWVIIVLIKTGIAAL